MIPSRTVSALILLMGIWIADLTAQPISDKFTMAYESGKRDFEAEVETIDKTLRFIGGLPELGRDWALGTIVQFQRQP